MSADPPASEAERFRHWITDDELVCNPPWIDHIRPLRWSGLLLCNVSQLSVVAIRLCRSIKDKPRYYNFPSFTISEVDEETGESTLELPEAAWVVTIKSLTTSTAEQLFSDELEKFNAIGGSSLQFANIITGALPESTARASFLIYMKAWEALDQQTQLDETVSVLLRGLSPIHGMIEIASQASSTTLANTMNRLKELLDDILALLQDISVYIFDRYGANDLVAHIPLQEAEANDAYDIEAYLARPDNLQKALYSLWSPAAAPYTEPAYDVVDESLGISQQNDESLGDTPTRTTDSYEVLNLLKPMDPSGYDPRRACLGGAREVMLNRIITWTQNRDHPEGLMWISGQVGIGKTAVATSLCERLDNIGAFAGSFFCRSDDPDSSDPLRLVNNIVHEIASRCSPYARGVFSAIRAKRTLYNAHLRLRYKGLIKSPLEKLKSLSMPVALVVIVDGLDECGDYDSREQILHLLYEMSELVPWLKVIITGRPVGDLQDSFRGNCPHEPITHLQTYDAAPDIRAYIEGQLSQLAETERWPPDSIDQLCIMSQGAFLWAALATKYIKKSIFPALPRLQKVLKNRKSPLTDHFDTLYVKALKTAIDDNEDEIKDAHLRCIGAILAISEHEPLAIPDLQYLLLVAGWIDQLTLERVVNNLTPLLLTQDGGGVRFRRGSLKDFVTNASRSGEFYIALNQYEADPAACCLKVMQRDLRFNICELETSHLLNSEVPDLKLRIRSHIGPALKYACIHWIDHFFSSPNQALVGATKEFLGGPQLMYWIEVLSLLGRLDVAIAGLAKLTSSELTQLGDWSVVASWGKDAHRFLLPFYDPIAASTPHLYVSALAFSPHKSITAMRMQPYFPNLITLANGSGPAWHPCVKSIVHPQPIQSLSMSPGGSRMAVGYSDGSLAVWDLQTGVRICGSLAGHRDSVTCVVYSPISDLIISSSEDTTIRIWDVAARLQTSHLLTGHSGPVYAVTSSPVSTMIASGSSDKAIRLWDPNTTRSIRGPYIGIQAV
ncbi:unnamed protein product [Rhizoctonia solani]|uniref:Nephrocystin 3-like N-terminal domain-containing protein n=1 Tax=Rhizoctonia solani TaxID=456999 RepID=A0A8H3DS71_9AGAM|nr:unnamed protein product [Rhizoctonia solani]